MSCGLRSRFFPLAGRTHRSSSITPSLCYASVPGDLEAAFRCAGGCRHLRHYSTHLGSEAMESPIGIDTILIRSLYLLLLAGIFGYISEFEKKQNERLLALSKTAAQAATLRERRRIMYELHDGILQSLATLICDWKVAGPPLKNPDRIGEEIESVENLTRDR